MPSAVSTSHGVASSAPLAKASRGEASPRREERTADGATRCPALLAEGRLVPRSQGIPGGASARLLTRRPARLLLTSCQRCRGGSAGKRCPGRSPRVRRGCHTGGNQAINDHHLFWREGSRFPRSTALATAASGHDGSRVSRSVSRHSEQRKDNKSNEKSRTSQSNTAGDCLAAAIAATANHVDPVATAHAPGSHDRACPCVPSRCVNLC